MIKGFEKARRVINLNFYSRNSVTLTIIKVMEYKVYRYSLDILMERDAIFHKNTNCNS